jgi:2-C-methyl-D-erythritol 4-phosphate cytidylyltransferase
MSDADAPSGSVGVVIVAAGSGSRLGADVPKAFARVAGRPLLGYAVDAVRDLPDLASLVVVAPPLHLDPSRNIWAGVWLPDGAVVVAGGAERTDSVLAGIDALDAVCDVVLVHDAARCFTPLAVFERVVAAVRDGASAVVPGIPVVDTVKEVDEAGWVTNTPDRGRLRAVQTPQGFRADILRHAHASPGGAATDDAALVERLGVAVRVVEGDAAAFKITTPDDIARAERLLAEGDARP